MKLWSDNVDLEELLDKDGNIRFREEVMKEKRDRRTQCLREQDQATLLSYSTELTIRARQVEDSSESWEDALKTNIHIISLNGVVEVLKIHMGVWDCLDRARVAETEAEFMEIAIDLMWTMISCDHQNAVAAFRCAAAKYNITDIAEPLDDESQLKREALGDQAAAFQAKVHELFQKSEEFQSSLTRLQSIGTGGR